MDTGGGSASQQEACAIMRTHAAARMIAREGSGGKRESSLGRIELDFGRQDGMRCRVEALGRRGLGDRVIADSNAIATQNPIG
jgi:hypothetical protein